MFLSSAAVMIATQIIGVVAIIIDGVITGWKLGMEAYLAISLIHPFVTIVLTLAGFISIGNQTRRSSQKREDLLFITEHILYSKIEKVPFIGSYYSLYVQSHERWDEWWDGKGRWTGLEIFIPIYLWFYPGEDPKFRSPNRIIHYHFHYIHFHETWNHAFTPDSHYCGPGFFIY